MRKGLIVLLVAVVAVAFALPAMADMTPTNLTVSGFYGSRAWVSNFSNGLASAPSLALDNAEVTNAYVEQRFRVRFAFGTENVQAIWYLESDMVWGDTAGGAPTALGGTSTTTNTLGAQRNSGGALGADRIQTETKNIYVWFKVPDTSVDVAVGLQNQSDDYAGFLYGGADMAGVFMNMKFEPVAFKFGWAKLYENLAQKTDDRTLYVAEAKFAPTKEVKIGANFYFLQDDADKVATGATLTNGLTGLAAPILPYAYKAKVYMPGVSAAFKAGPATISGFAQYQTGKLEATSSVNPDVDINAYLVDLRADLNLGPGKFFVEGLYTSGGDNTADEYKAPITLATNEASPAGNSTFNRTNMHLLLPSPSTLNISQCLIGCSGGVSGADPGNRGRGIWLLAAGYSQMFTDKLKGEVNVGYLSATEMLKTDNSNRSEDMGTEINAQLNYNLAKGLDVGVIGAYVFLGDFYKTSAGDTPADPWVGIARVNYAF